MERERRNTQHHADQLGNSTYKVKWASSRQWPYNATANIVGCLQVPRLPAYAGSHIDWNVLVKAHNYVYAMRALCGRGRVILRVAQRLV